MKNKYKNLMILSVIALSVAVYSFFYYSENKIVNDYILVPENNDSTKKVDKSKHELFIHTRKKILSKISENIIPIIYTDSSWETKTLYDKDGEPITYIFGEGNPKEVALSEEEIKKLPEKVLKDKVAFLTYMTPEAEIGMRNFLENPALPKVIEKCYKELNWYGNKNYAYAQFPHDFSLEYIMYIDPNTGRKEFRKEFLDGISNLFSMKTHLYDNRSKCLNEDEYYLLEELKQEYILMPNYAITEPVVDLGSGEILSNPLSDSLPPPDYNTSTPDDNNFEL